MTSRNKPDSDKLLKRLESSTQSNSSEMETNLRNDLKRQGLSDIDAASLEFLLKRDEEVMQREEEQQQNYLDKEFSSKELHKRFLDDNVVQMKMLEMLERQNAALIAIQADMGKWKEEHNQKLSVYASAARSDDSEVLNVDGLQPNYNQISLRDQLKQWMENLWLYRFVQDAYEGARRNNIQVRLDFNLLIKISIMVMIFGGRAMAKSARRGSKFKDWEVYHRIGALSLISLFLWLFQTGILHFMLRLMKDFLQYIDRAALADAVPGNMMGDDGRPNVHRGQRHRNLEEALNEQRETEPNNAQQTQTDQAPPLSDGGIAQDGGLGMDLFYFVIVYFLSLLPTWRPQVPEAQDTPDNHAANNANVHGVDN